MTSVEECQGENHEEHKRLSQVSYETMISVCGACGGPLWWGSETCRCHGWGWLIVGNHVGWEVHGVGIVEVETVIFRWQLQLADLFGLCGLLFGSIFGWSLGPGSLDFGVGWGHVREHLLDPEAGLLGPGSKVCTGSAIVCRRSIYVRFRGVSGRVRRSVGTWLCVPIYLSG